MDVTVKELEAAIRNKIQERQGYLDKANACVGAVEILQGLLKEAQKKTDSKKK